MAVEEKTSKRLLDIQKLQLDLKNHMEQDERVFSEFKALLTSIDNKLTTMTVNDSTHNTDVAVLKTQFQNHLNEHKTLEEKGKTGTIWIGLGLTVLTIIINLITWALQHIVVK